MPSRRTITLNVHPEIQHNDLAQKRPSHIFGSTQKLQFTAGLLSILLNMQKITGHSAAPCKKSGQNDGFQLDRKTTSHQSDVLDRTHFKEKAVQEQSVSLCSCEGSTVQSPEGSGWVSSGSGPVIRGMPAKQTEQKVQPAFALICKPALLNRKHSKLQTYTKVDHFLKHIPTYGLLPR